METSIAHARSPYHPNGSATGAGGSGHANNFGGAGVRAGGGNGYPNSSGASGQQSRSSPQPTASLETKLLEETYDRLVKHVPNFVVFLRDKV